ARWFAITGGIGRGKSALLRRLADKARAREIAVGGFSQERTERGELVVYDLVRWNGERQKLGERDGRGGFRFAEGVFSTARAWLRSDAQRAKLFLIDELGKLEAAGGGHVPALQELIALRSDAVIVAVIRKEKLSAMREFFAFDDNHLLDMDERADRAEEFLHQIIQTAS
ncbi:MAG: nucleoside-triphosphatase, partial [bacterium]|nr:nucleoside-triphosphatase [bacterium]